MATVSVTLCSVLIAGNAIALSDQWYFGIGGVGSKLDPNPRQPGLGLTESVGTGATLILGRDLDDRSSVQLQLSSLGEAEFDNGVTAAYSSADAAVLYRLFDSRDRNLYRDGFGVAFYGRFALGLIHRESDQALEDDALVHFSIGAGLETFLLGNLSLRAEASYHELDASSGNLSLVYRFGGTPSRTLAAPQVPAPEPTSTIQSVPIAADVASSEAGDEISDPDPEDSAAEIVSKNADVDGDGVADGVDQCLSSARGFPVRENGCPLFDGVLSGVRFVEGAATLEPGSDRQLDSLINVLLQHPDARIELHAHSDNTGTVKEQAVLTRARLRSVGTYLLERGIRSNRMVLRSFGGAKPRFNNDSEDGRLRNNRIEVFEKRQ